MSIKSDTRPPEVGQKENHVVSKRTDPPFRRCNVNVMGEGESVVPELDARLYDLIRILEKLAHSASRTKIICEPFVPAHSLSRFHRNCYGSSVNLKLRSKSKPTLIWNPVQPETYYYDCYNYSNFPDRDDNYREIDEKYKQVKQNKPSYGSADGDEEKISKLLSDGSPKQSRSSSPGRFEQDRCHESSNRSLHANKPKSHLMTSSESENEDECLRSQSGDLSQRSEASKKSSKSKSLHPYKSDVEELKAMIRRHEDENLLRFQEMLSLMREMSTKEFCRATCAIDKTNHGPVGDDRSTHGAKEEMCVSSSESFMKLSSKSANLNKDDFAGKTVRPGSEQSLCRMQKETVETSSHHSKASLRQPSPQSKSTSVVGDTELTLQELMEMSNNVADLVVFESVKELMKNKQYSPPSKRSGTLETASKQKFVRESERTLKMPSSVNATSTAEGRSAENRESSRILSCSKGKVSAGSSSHGQSRNKSTSHRTELPSTSHRTELPSTSEDRSSAREKPKTPSVCNAVCSRPAADKKPRAGSIENPNCPKHGRLSDPATAAESSRTDSRSARAQSLDFTSQKSAGVPSGRPKKHPSPCFDSSPKRESRPSSYRESSPSFQSKESSPAFQSNDFPGDGSVLYYARTTKNAFPPQRESAKAAGFMLRSAYDYTIPPRGQIIVKTDLLIELPPDSYGRLAPRNCILRHFSIDVVGDVIDHDYEDVVTVVLINHSDAPVPIKRGAKVAQLICERIYQPKVQEKYDLQQKK